MSINSPAALIKLFQTEYQDSLTELIDDTDLDLESEFINSQAVDLERLSAGQVTAIQDLNIRSILTEALAGNVTFEQKGLELWASRAFAFYNENFDHWNFVDLFSDEKSYTEIISDHIQIDKTTSNIRYVIERDTNTDLTGYIVPNFSSDLSEMLRSIAEQALYPALEATARTLAETKRRPQKLAISEFPTLNKISKNRSFNDKRGSINFELQGDRLAIEARDSNDRAPRYKSA